MFRSMTMFILLTSCGKGSGFSSFDIMASQSDAQEEQATSIDEGQQEEAAAPAQDNMPQADENQNQDEVNVPVMVTGALLASCTSTSKQQVRCLFSTDTVPEDFDFSKIKIYDQESNEVPSNLLTFQIIDSQGKPLLEITVSTGSSIGQVAYNQPSVTNNQSTTQLPDTNSNTSTEETNLALDCSKLPGDWVLAPGDLDYGTQDFCVMKYEAKNGAGSPVSEAAGSPWASINQTEAIAACASLGSGYRLTSNEEWMTITANAASIGSNWSGGETGNGMIFIGHSDGDPNEACPADADDSKSYVESNCTGKIAGGDNEANQKRTHTLSNGSVIWDLAGNLREWTTYVNSSDKPKPRDDNYQEYTLPITGSTSLPLSHLIPTRGVKGFWKNGWNSSQGIGQGRIGAEGVGGALSRGGGFKGDNRNGIFRFRLDQGPDMVADTIGFRCTYSE